MVACAWHAAHNAAVLTGVCWLCVPQDPFNRESRLHSELANVSRVWPSVSSNSRMSELRQRSKASIVSSTGSGMSGAGRAGLAQLHGGAKPGTMPSTIAEHFSKDVRDVAQV